MDLFGFFCCTFLMCVVVALGVGFILSGTSWQDYLFGIAVCIVGLVGGVVVWVRR